MMTYDEFMNIRNEIKNTSNGTLIYMLEEYLNKIKDLLTISKMLVVEVQVRKEVENGKQPN